MLWIRKSHTFDLGKVGRYINMAAFCRKKAMERNRSSRPSGHSRTQMKVEFTREKPFFGVNLRPPMLSGKAIFYVFIKIVN